MSNVRIKLAHPLEERDALALGLPVDEQYGPGDEIIVSRDLAIPLINSGMAAVDPENKDAVAAALTPSKATAGLPLGKVKVPAAARTPRADEKTGS